MKKIFLLSLIFTKILFADGEIFYTVLPQMAYFTTTKIAEDNTAKGMIEKLIEDLAKEKKLSSTFVEFKTGKDAIESAKAGYGSGSSSLDLIGGVYYDEKIAEYMEYIYPPIFEDYLLLILPSESNFELKEIADFKILDKQMPAVVIQGVELGTWWKNLTADKNLEWRDHVVSSTIKNAKPLKVVEVENIDKAIELVVKGKAYFVGSGLMVKDLLARYPKLVKKIKGQFIRNKGRTMKKSLFIAVNNDFLDLFDSLDFAKVLSEKIYELKKSGELDTRIQESKKEF
ncbi:MAG: hypothetical protein ACTSXL_03605 [Alphaproteobacteria bacterium]